MTDVAQELMTPHETARWFRRSPAWLRQQSRLLRVGGPGMQPLYHVRVCRAYVLGQLCGLDEAELRRVQVAALTVACGLAGDRRFQPGADAQEQADLATSKDSVPPPVEQYAEP